MGKKVKKAKPSKSKQHRQKSEKSTLLNAKSETVIKPEHSQKWQLIGKIAKWAVRIGNLIPWDVFF